MIFSYYNFSALLMSSANKLHASTVSNLAVNGPIYSYSKVNRFAELTRNCKSCSVSSDVKNAPSRPNLFSYV